LRILRLVLLLLVFGLIVIQFIRPEKNKASGPSESNIGRAFAVPAAVQTILQRSCYDCHSNSTVYPWYAEVEPVGWWLNKHIQDGRQGLNYDEYTSYRLMKQYRRFKDVIDKVEKGEMPLPSYLLIHRYVRLTLEEKNELVQWCTAMRDSMKARFPLDSLERRQRK
jgi:hypothetical protein